MTGYAPERKWIMDNFKWFVYITVWIVSAAFSIYVAVLIVMALLKFIGS